MTRLVTRAALTIAMVVGAVAACGGGSTPPPPTKGPLFLERTGRVERGSTIQLVAKRPGALAPSQVAFSASPSDGAQIGSDGRATFLRTGIVVLSVRDLSDNQTATMILDVPAPPVVVFDLLGSDGNRDIYRVALDGGELTRLTTDPGDDSRPNVSSGVVAFTSYRNGNGDLYSVPLGGGAERRLTTGASDQSDAALSRDGLRLAFTDAASGVSKLWTASSDGTGPARLAQTFGFPSSIEASPRWSPTGDRVAFVSTVSGSADIYAVAIAGGAVSTLVGGSSADIDPSWNPDGASIVFASDRAGGATDLYVVTIATGVATRLTSTPGDDAQPTWLTDGRIVYVAWVNGVPRLRWLDPADLATVHDIDTGVGAAMHPAAP